MSLFDKFTPEEKISSELRRFNDNFERYLDFLKVPKTVKCGDPGHIEVVEPVDELAAAIREHAIITGRAENDR